MPSKTYLRLALPTPLRRLFDYLPPQGVDIKSLIPGVRVKVPFQSRTLIGILIEVVATTEVPPAKLKAVLEVLDEKSQFAEDVFKICHWAADYYQSALGEVLSAALPVMLRKGKSLTRKRKKVAIATVQDHPPMLNADQMRAVTAINEAQHHFQTFLLDGVTGSGKTEVYLHAIADVLVKDKQVLVLVPEISLTPQTIARFRARFPVQIAALHSELSDGERLLAWQAASLGEARIVIGTRSAIFTPFSELGLIIVDEEHDSSFKQQDRFRYHARDLAVLRANINQIPIVLGSATPSLESLFNVERKRYTCLSLPERAGGALLPTYQLIDLRATKAEEGLSQILLQTMQAHLTQGNQVMLFLNRRGFAPVFYCSECSWMVECKRCDARMVYHRSPPRLQCHHCDAHRALPKRCEQCQQETMQPVGVGTQRLEETLAKHFPDVTIIRIDRDSTRLKGSMEALLEQVHTTKKAILLGTQMLAKGHHFPDVTLVGLIDADNGLFSADFRAAENMGQMLLQVSGRAGRAEKPGTVMLQTNHPDHPLLQTLINQGYAPFAKALLNERESALLPPFSYFTVLRAEAYKEKDAVAFLEKIKDTGETFVSQITILGPVANTMKKRKGLHCQQLLIRAEKRSTMQHYLKEMLKHLDALSVSQPVKWVLDVDPLETG
ncbi:MAG: primosomal protein N' [Gammaproteobacteria bacterium]